MKLLSKSRIAIAGFVFFATNALTAMAQYPQQTPIPGPNGPITNGASGIILFVDQVATWVAYLFWALAVIFIFYAAFLYLTAGGDEEKIKKANHQLIYAVIAIVVALFAYGLPFLVNSILAQSGGGGGSVPAGRYLPPGRGAP